MVDGGGSLSGGRRLMAHDGQKLEHYLHCFNFHFMEKMKPFDDPKIITFLKLKKTQVLKLQGYRF